MAQNATTTLSPAAARERGSDWLAKEKIAWLALALLVGVAISEVAVATTSGPGVGPDSVTYMSTAKNLADGQGLFLDAGYWTDGGQHINLDTKRPFTQQPPLYPVLLALGVRAGLQVQDSARLLGMLAAAGLVITMFMLGTVLQGEALALMLAMFVGCFAPLVRTESFALSESSFIVLIMLSFFFLLKSLSGPTGGARYAWTAVAGLFCALALLTRYIGLAFWGASILGIAFAYRNRKRELVWALIIFSAPVLALNIPWFWHNWLISGKPTGIERISNSHPSLTENLNLLFGGLASDMMPNLQLGFKQWLAGRWGLLVLSVLLVVLIGFLFGWSETRKKLVNAYRQGVLAFEGDTAVRIGIIAIFAFAYTCALLLLSNTILFPGYDWPRYLAPVYPFIIIGSFSVIVALIKKLRTRYVTICLAVIVLFSLFAYAVPSFQYVLAAAEGQEFNGKVWRQSDGIHYLRASLEPGDLIFSDQAPAVQFYLNRVVYGLPPRGDKAGVDVIVEAAKQTPKATYLLIFKGQLEFADPYFNTRLGPSEIRQAAASNSHFVLLRSFSDSDLFVIVQDRS